MILQHGLLAGVLSSESFGRVITNRRITTWLDGQH
jgi:hypothetical protein